MEGKLGELGERKGVQEQSAPKVVVDLPNLEKGS
jgi:hypothetical protein